jgi:phage portal protein BeeE
MFPGIYPAAVGAPPVRGARQTLENYSKMPWLRAVASRVGNSFAAVEWKLYATGPRGGRAVRDLGLQRAGCVERKKMLERKQAAGELREITDHPFLGLMHSANPHQTGYTMRKLAMIYLDLVGEAVLVKERGPGNVPVAAYPIPPSWVVGTPTPSHRSYQVGYRSWQVEIPDTEVLWLRDPDPANPYGRGTGLSMSLGDELEIGEYASRFLRQFFSNNARPDLIVAPKGEGELREAEARRLEQRWVDQLQGYWRAFKPFFLSRAVEVTTFDQADFRGMQMDQLRKSERDTIIHTWGVPPELFGILENSNRSTIDSAWYLMALVVLVPRLEFFRAELQERLIPEYDDRLVLDYVSPVTVDREYILKAAQLSPWALDADEWRDLMGKEPKPNGEGKIHMVPFNLVPTATLAEVAPPEPEPPPAPTPAAPPPSPAAGWSRLLRGDARVLAAAGDRDGERAVLKALAGDPADLPALTRVAARLEPAMRRRFLAAAEAARGRINLEALAAALESGSLPAAEAAAMLDGLEQGLGHLVNDLRAGFLAGGGVGHAVLEAAGVSMSLDLLNPRAVAWARTVGAARVTEITAETRAAVRGLIERAFTEGRDARKTARAIRDVVGLHSRQLNAVENFRARLEADGTLTDAVVERRTARYAEAQLRLRAQTIARTELMTASNQGQQSLWEAARAEGLLRAERTKRVWILTPDDRLCEEICEPMEDQEVGLDEPFTTGAGEQIAAPPAHPSCRCAVGLKILREE